MDIREYVYKICLEAKEAARSIARATSSEKNQVLIKMAGALKDRASELIAENMKEGLRLKLCLSQTKI
jgi:gamma-glutamyl phosphate reductase